MHITIKYFYENGKEMKQGDLAYLEGGESWYGLDLSGIFKIANIKEDILTVYFLGQDRKEYQSIEIEVDSINILVPIESDELSKLVEKTKTEIFDKIKNRE